jgi:hypothetical protein
MNVIEKVDHFNSTILHLQIAPSIINPNPASYLGTLHGRVILPPSVIAFARFLYIFFSARPSRVGADFFHLAFIVVQSLAIS